MAVNNDFKAKNKAITVIYPLNLLKDPSFKPLL